MRRSWLVSLLPALLIAAVAVRGQVPLVTATRSALGGDVALNAVTSFTVTASLTRTLDRPMSFANEISWQAPDKFVRMDRQDTSAGGPMGGMSITTFRGFNGDAPIFEQQLPSFLAPPPPPPSMTGGTPEAIAAARAKRINGAKHDAAPLLLVLFAASFSGYPFEFSAPTDGQPNAFDAKGPDGFTWRVFVDPATHLVTRVTWRAAPLVTFSSSGTVAVGRRSGIVSGSMPPPPPTGDPTVGLAEVEWQIAFADYKTDKGLTWPRRMTTTYGGKAYEDSRFGSFKLNPKIDPKIFRPRG